MARAPEVFSLDPAPHAVRPHIAVVETPDVFEAPPAGADEPGEPRATFWRKAFISAFFGFLTLAFTVWAADFISGLLQRFPPLGYAALALAVLAGVALLVMLVREFVAVWRLRSVVALRAEATAAAGANDMARARDFVGKISDFYAKDAGSARARAALAAHGAEIIDGPDLIALAERELLADKDRQVREAIAAAASRVAMVTTISPRAWVDIAFVLAQSLRLIRTIATLYSGRPGGIAIWRLSARVATHLAVTGGVAVAQDAIGQFLGAGLMARLSSKLGEGVLNGVLTARVGLSAIAVCRPMPFRALEAPQLSDVAGALLSRSTPEKTVPEKSAG